MGRKGAKEQREGRERKRDIRRERGRQADRGRNYCKFRKIFRPDTDAAHPTRTVPMYINDVSPTQVRGAFGVFHQLFVTIGILVATVLGMSAVFGNEKLWFLLYGLFVVPAGINFGRVLGA